MKVRILPEEPSSFRVRLKVRTADFDSADGGSTPSLGTKQIMFEDLDIYMIKSRDERRAHLRLNEECVEIGGDSIQFRGLLAHYLKTTLPRKKQRFLLCHACNNSKCSNVNHLYWGTDADNARDRNESPNYVSTPKILRARWGEEKYNKHMKNLHKKGGESHALTAEQLERYRDIFADVDFSIRGMTSALAKDLNISHTHIRRIRNRLGM